MKKLLFAFAIILTTLLSFAQNEIPETMAAYRDFCLKINEAINCNNVDMLKGVLEKWGGATDEIIYKDNTIHIAQMSQLIANDTMREVNLKNHIVFLPSFIDSLIVYNDTIIDNGFRVMPVTTDIYRHESTRAATMTSVLVSHHAIAKNDTAVYSANGLCNMQLMVIPEFGGKLNVTIKHIKNNDNVSISDNATGSTAAFFQCNTSGDYTITVENQSDKDISFVLFTEGSYAADSTRKVNDTIDIKYKRLDEWRRLAEYYKNIGDYNNSRRYYDQILSLNSSYQDETMVHLADLFIKSGQYNEALSLLENVNLGKRDNERLMSLAHVYSLTNRNSEAIEIYKKVYTMASKNEKNAFLKVVLQNEGVAYWNMDSLDRALECFNKAVDIADDDTSKYKIISNLAIIESETNRIDSAEKHINQCVEWQRKNLGENNLDYVISIRKKAEIMIKKGDVVSATAAYKEYFEKERSLIIGNFAYMTENERQNYWNTKRFLLAQCYETENQEPEFLYNVALFSKSGLIQASLNFNEIIANDSVSLHKYEEIKKMRSDGKNLNIAERLEHELMTKYGDMKSFNEKINVTASDVRKALKTKKDVAIEFVKYYKNHDVHYAALLLFKDKPCEFVYLFREKDFLNSFLKNDKSFGTIEEAIYSRDSMDKNCLYSDSIVGEKVWGEIFEKLPHNPNIYFSPDGIFHLLSIENLDISGKKANFYRLSATSMLTEKRQTNSGMSMLLVGGVNYNDMSMAHVITDTTPDRSTSRLLAIDQMPPVVGGKYDYLRGSQKEVETISRIFGNDSCTAIVGAESTEGRVKNEMPLYRVVHISTHGFCTYFVNAPATDEFKDSISIDLSLLRCGVLLSGANKASLQKPENDSIEDGVLSAREICDLDLRDVDMVVLSTCQSGLGQLTSDGVSGFAKALKKAGVATVVLSLWEVNDDATQLLMTKFYENLKNGDTKNNAFTKAMNYIKTFNDEVEVTKSVFNPATLVNVRKKILKKVSYEDPYYWASFIMIDGI